VKDSDFESAVGEYMDLRLFAQYLAAENFLADYDNFLGAWGPNNFYVYRFQGQKTMQIIPWDKDLAFWAFDRDIFQGIDANVLARRVLAIPGYRQVFLETLIKCAALSMQPVSEENPMGWLEAETRAEIAQFHAAGLADRQKSFTDERFEDELTKVLAFASKRGPYVMHDAQEKLAELLERQLK
jgi:hypothetical protein